MADDKRRFTRVPFKTKAQFTVEDKSFTADELYNLSVGGCFLPVAANVKVGASVSLSIALSDTDTDVYVRVEGEIIRSEPNGVAVKFTQIDPDSLFHLQNIIRYNAEDSEAINEEIKRHPGLI